MTSPRHANVIAFADLLARLIHRFTDREGLLDARGLSEDDVARLEQAALETLAGDASASATFTHAFVAARAALLTELDVPGSAPPSIPASLLDATIHDVPRGAIVDDSVIEPALLETLLSGVRRGSK
jgi:hypothetical protein